MADAGLGCYIHVPFCAHRCDYCAFATFTDRDHLVEAYVDAVLTDIARTRTARDGVAPETIYIGGGTPSLLPPGALARLLESAGARTAREVTVECNPDSTSLELLSVLYEAGVTRISLGVQSLHGHVLDSLGRRQVTSAVEHALDLVRAVGFSSYNVDLVYGAAAERDEDFRSSLVGVLELAPNLPHLSAYALTVEPGTPLARDPARYPDDDACAERYDIAEEVLGNAGLHWYEISNWARPGHECLHNLSCWAGGEYLAFGSGAHGHLDGVRFANVTTPERYIERIAAHVSPVARHETLPGAEAALERLELALRTRSGVPVGSLDLDDPALEGLVTVSGEQIVLTRRGRLLANEVAIRLAVPGASERQPARGAVSPQSVAVFGR